MRLDFKKNRDRDFLSSFREVIKSRDKQDRRARKADMLEEAVLRPAKRFYVSEEQCLRVISRMMRDGSCGMRNPLKRRMYGDIFDRVSRIMAASRRPLSEIVCEVVNGEAPRFYISAGSAAVLYYNLSRER